MEVEDVDFIATINDCPCKLKTFQHFTLIHNPEFHSEIENSKFWFHNSFIKKPWLRMSLDSNKSHSILFSLFLKKMENLRLSRNLDGRQDTKDGTFFENY